MSEVILVNKMESAVGQEVDRMLIKNEDICSCSQCKLDVMALALNSLPPKYVVTRMGNAVTNVNLVSFQWKADVTMAVCQAAEMVRKHPRHS